MRFNDLDMFGHVNNTVYLQYMDLGKEEYIKQVIGDMSQAQNEALVIVNINCDFCQISLYREPLEVRTHVEAIGKHSVVFQQEIANKATNEIKCRCRTVMAGFSPSSNETIEIPLRWRHSISAFEGKPL
ncbi:MAG: acyl-CoA thioesterase [Clostridium sp.]|nr:acyl-CoA thioesterase [Clostridium sp.]